MDMDGQMDGYGWTNGWINTMNALTIYGSTRRRMDGCVGIAMGWEEVFERAFTATSSLPRHRFSSFLHSLHTPGALLSCGIAQSFMLYELRLSQSNTPTRSEVLGAAQTQCKTIPVAYMHALGIFCLAVLAAHQRVARRRERVVALLNALLPRQCRR
eukprot:352033-Chlamydomonas_euryale.AAC.3